MTLKKTQVPFTISSSLVQGGYLTDFQSKFRSGVEITNYHEDKISEVENDPLQGPFTQQWVGGFSHRHIDFNKTGLDNARTRPEAWHLISNPSSVRIYSHKILNSPPAYWTRDSIARRPVNIKNIQTTTGSVNYGNYTLNYEVVHSAGRHVNSFAKNVITGSETLGFIRTRFVTGTNVNFDNQRPSLDTLQSIRNKTVFVNRFNAPGGVNESTRASLDLRSEEISVNNPLTFRNIGVRTTLRNMLSGSQQQFNTNNMIHGVNRNTLTNNTGLVKHDNFYVQRPVPRTDIQYAWISSSATTKAIDLGGFQSFNGTYNRKKAFEDIHFRSETLDEVINAGKKEFNVNLLTNTLEPITKIDLTSFTSNTGLSGSNFGFTLTNRAAIRIKTDTNEPWIVLFGGSISGSTLPGTASIDYRFTTPIKLSFSTFGGDATFGSPNDPDFNEHLIVQYSIDEKNSWTPLYYPRMGDINVFSNWQKDINLDFDISTPFFIRFTTDNSREDESWAIKGITAFPMIQHDNFDEYSFSPWKQIRQNESPISRNLRSKNIISISDITTDKNRKVGPVQTIKARRADSVSNFVEPLVTSKYKPLVHRFIFKGNVNPFLAHEVVHTYNNNLTMFANKDLNNKLSVEEIRDQFYNRLLEFINDPNKLEDDNPIAKFLGYTIKEVVYPKEENTGLGKIRSRQQYILNKPGFDRDGYDRQFGTQRVFWRDSYYDRMRSASGSFNSQNTFVGMMNITATFHDNYGASYAGYEGAFPYSSYMSSSLTNIGQNSVLPIENLLNFNQILTASYIVTGNSPWAIGVFTSSVRGYAWENAGELNNGMWIDTFAMNLGNFGAGGGSANLVRNTELSLFLLQTTARLFNLQQTPGGLPSASVSGDGLPYIWYIENSSSFIPTPRIRYCAFVGGYLTGSRNFQDPFSALPTGKLTSSLDFGLSYVADQMSGKKPWFDSYDKYVDDIRGLTKTYSVLPEFRISEHIRYYVSQSGGNFRAPNKAFLSIDGVGNEYRSGLIENGIYSNNFFKTYINSDSVKNLQKLTDDSKKTAKLDKISFKVSGIKKLLPYNGFYPINRTVQIANLYSEYINHAFHGGYYITPKQLTAGGQNDPVVVVNNNLAQAAYKQTALEPLFSPGILYNTIKSGIAVDWPGITASFVSNVNNNSFDYPLFYNPDNTGNTNVGTLLSYRSFISTRIPFETILDPTLGFAIKPKINVSSLNSSIITDSYMMGHFDTSAHSFIQQGNNDTDYIGSIPFTYIVKGSQPAPLYQMSINNFLAETVHFFLEDEKMNTFVSLEESKWKVFDANKVYYMDLVLRKDPSLVMVEAFSSSFTLKTSLTNQPSNTANPVIPSNTLHGRYFGYPVDMSSGNVGNGGWGVHHDPAYAPYTPPYFEGEAGIRIKFAPSVTQKYTLDEIFQQSTLTNIFDELGLKVHTGSVAYLNKMGLDSCINIFGSTRLNEVEFNPLQGSKASLIKQSTDTTRNAWIISPKLETPVLDFSQQPIVQKNGPYWTGAGFGRGMWSGYGQIPSGSKGIYFELRESFPIQNNRIGSKIGSLLQQVGFTPQSKKIGQIAQSKQISEAVVIIPYLDYEIANVTTNIDGHNFIKIDKNVFDVQKQNIENGEAAIKINDLGSKTQIHETSISKMLSTMTRYIIPPQFNFLAYPDIDPIAMYFFEFKHTLSQQDLSDIWQGLMPTIATTAQLDQILVEHESGPYEFFAGRELPENLRWMVFKVKKKAEKSYYAVTADVSDDDRFKFDFQIGRKEPEYSYNWPYDYFSLVEFAKVELTLDYKNRDTEDKITQGQTSNFTKSILDETKKRRGRKKKQ